MIKGVRLEKVDDHTIRVYVEKGDDVPVERLIANRKALTDSIAKNELILVSGEIAKQIQDNIDKLKGQIKENEVILAEKSEEKKLQEEIDRTKEVVKNIDELIAEAKALGVE